MNVVNINLVLYTRNRRIRHDSKTFNDFNGNRIKKRVNSSVSYEVEAQSIGRIFGLAHELINEGDTIRIKDTGFTPKLYLEARVIAGDESFGSHKINMCLVIIVKLRIRTKNYEKFTIESLVNSAKTRNAGSLDKLVKEANETASSAKKRIRSGETLAEKVQENIKTILLKS